jgi:hypothetical protein
VRKATAESAEGRTSEVIPLGELPMAFEPRCGRPPTRLAWARGCLESSSSEGLEERYRTVRERSAGSDHLFGGVPNRNGLEVPRFRVRVMESSDFVVRSGGRRAESLERLGVGFQAL